MLLPHDALVALVDGRKLELWRNRGTDSAPKLEAREAPTLHPHDKGAGARHYSSSGNPTGHLLEEDAHAAAVADWLNREATAGKLSGLVVIAAPRTLGELRRHYNGKLKSVLLKEVSKDLAGKPAPQIIEALRAH